MPDMRSDENPCPPAIQRRRLAANLSFLFTEWDFLDRFAAAADAGFSAAEFLFPYEYPAETIAGKAQDSGLEITLFNCPPGDWGAGERGIAALPARADEFAAGLERSLNYAEVLGTRHLHVMAGIADPADPLAMATYRRNLALAGERAGASGVRILIEPINGYDMPGYFLRDFAMAAEIVGSGADVGLQFDLYHCARLHGGVLDRLEALLPVTRHIQIAGIPGRHEPADPALPLRRIFELLDRAGYPGRVGCEYHPADGTLRGLGWIKTLETFP